MKKVVLFGTSAAAEVAHFSFSHDSPYDIAAFTVDGKYLKEETFCGLPVVPFEEVQSLYPPAEYDMFVAVYASRINRTRAEKYQQAKAKGYELVSYISSKAITWPGLIVGENCLISEGVICKPFLRIGDNVVVLPGANLGHHAVIQDHCFIAAHAIILGAATIGSHSVIGANAVIQDAMTVAPECVIGAGVVINKPTQEKEVYVVTPPTLLSMPSDKMANFLFSRRS